MAGSERITDDMRAYG